MSSLKPVKTPSHFVVIPSSEVFTKAFKQLSLATHWVDKKGKFYKLPRSLATFYSEGLHTYNSFVQDNKKLYKTNKQYAADLGLGEQTITRVYKPLLKRMGLFKGTHDRQKFLELENLIGKLVTVNHTKDTLPNITNNQYIDRHKLTDEQRENYLKGLELKKKLRQAIRDIDNRPLEDHQGKKRLMTGFTWLDE